jgi:hypothetical protein
VLEQQLPGHVGEQRHPKAIRQRQFGFGGCERSRRERSGQRIGNRLPRLRFRKGRVELGQRRKQQRFFQYPRDGAFGLSDDADACVGGGAEVGEAQHHHPARLGVGQGHVDQAGSSDVTR